jgi:maltose-binding protein MalE
MSKRAAFFAPLVVILVVATLMSCGRGYESVDTDVEGEITVMLWSGDNTFMEDIGRRTIAVEDLRGQNQAAAYAVAQEFNKIYPNVKINVFAKAEGPDDDNGNWAQHRENFRAEYGHYPDIWAATDIPGDIARGLITDLSRFSDDPMYQSFNPAIMEMMNYNGFQAGLPQYLLPWGVYVNRALAEDNNLDVPDPDWDIEDFTDFISQADMKNFFGVDGAPLSFIETGTKSIRYSLTNYEEGEYVDLDSDEVKDLVDYLPEWAEHSIWPNFEAGNIPQEVMDENWWWGYKFFIAGKLLALPGDPWMMGDAAHPNPEHWGVAQSSDWDIYPRPATPYQPATVGVVLDPMVVYNYAMDDGDPAMSEDEEQKAQLAYTFMSFWVGDSRSWKARAEQLFTDGDVQKTAMNDSFPFVSDPEVFEEQMGYWYSTETHQRFADEARMPGFHKVLEIWQDGQIWDVSDKSFPWYHDFEGERRLNLYEWSQIGNAEITGAGWLDPNLADVVKSRLSDWERSINGNFRTSVAEMEAGLERFYSVE